MRWRPQPSFARLRRCCCSSTRHALHYASSHGNGLDDMSTFLLKPAASSRIAASRSCLAFKSASAR